MADERSELEELRRLEELERKAAGQPAFVTPKQRATPVSPEVKERVRSLSEQAGEYLFGEPERTEFSGSEVGGAAAVGGAGGLVLPKALQKGGALISRIPTTPTKVIGSAAQALGTGMEKIPALKRMVGGALGGAVGSTAEQTAEIAGAPKVVSLPVGLVAGGVAPELQNTIKKLVAKAGSVFVGTEGMANAIMRDLKSQGIEVSPKLAQLIEEEVNKFRGAPKGARPQEELYSALKTGATDITSEAQKRAGAAVFQGQITADQIRNSAQSQANQILRDAQEKSKKIRDSARAMSPQMRQMAESDAQKALSEGQQQAKRIQDEANKRIVELRQKAGALTQRATTGEQAAQQALAPIGQAQTPTQVGTNIRQAVNPIFERLKQVRSENAEKLKGEAFNFALQKEQAGQQVSQTNAFKDAISEIDRALINPETKLTNVSVDEVRSQLAKVKRALDPREVDPATGTVTGRPISFQALENLRRFLRDRAYGLPAEGFDAIGQQQAGKLADAVENIQREFSPGIGKFLEQYRADSQPLNAFKTKLGEAIVGKEEFDMGRFATDPAALGDKFFKSETGVKELINLMGGDAKQVEQLARSYVADKLRTGSASDVRNLLKSSRDWIGQFPQIEQQLQTATQQMERAGKFAGARTKLAQALRTEAGGLPIKAGQETETVLSRAAKEAQKASEQRIKTAATGLRGEKKMAADVVKQAEKEAKGVLQAAESPADQAIREARTAGQQITQEAEQRVKTILGSQFPNEEIEKLMLSGSAERWNEVAPILARSEQGKQNIEAAVRQVMSRVSSNKMGDVFRDNVRQRLEMTGLMSADKLNSMQTDLDYISNMTLSPEQKMSLLQRITKNILTTIPATTVGAPVGALVGND